MRARLIVLCDFVPGRTTVCGAVLMMIESILCNDWMEKLHTRNDRYCF